MRLLLWVSFRSFGCVLVYLAILLLADIAVGWLCAMNDACFSIVRILVETRQNC